MTMSFTNQTVIITGGTRGIGAAIASAFLNEGAKVILTYTNSDEAASRFKKEHAPLSDRIDCRKFDVSKESEVKAFYESLDQSHSEVDILINNAGIRRDAIVGMLTEEDWDAVLDTNLKGCYLMSKFAVQRMSRNRKGNIINITSPSGRLGFPGQSNYAASKAGMIAFTKSLAQEVAKRNIRVNCVSPGFTSTDLISDLKDETLEKYKTMIPLQRFGTAEEVAHSVLFLASNKASYITGSVLEVTGGL